MLPIFYILSGRIGTGATAVPSSPWRSGSGSSANWGSASGRPGPSPHARWRAPPHGRGRQHPSGRRETPGGHPGPRSQDRSGSDLLAIDLSSIHVLQCLLCIIWTLEFYIGITFGEMWIEPVEWHINHLYLSVSGKYFHYVILGHVSGESPNM